MSTYYSSMSVSRLRDLLDEKEEQLYEMDMTGEDYSLRAELNDLINNICELLYTKERQSLLA
ncbi:MAG: hypothetical protein MJ135_03785 [Oscillospiraceae bacterium]|nr:hypothetical protein [Oscillospiraceae bacterium]